MTAKEMKCINQFHELTYLSLHSICFSGKKKGPEYLAPAAMMAKVASLRQLQHLVLADKICMPGDAAKALVRGCPALRFVFGSFPECFWAARPEVTHAFGGLRSGLTDSYYIAHSKRDFSLPVL